MRILQWIRGFGLLSEEAKKRIVEIVTEGDRSGRSVQEQLVNEGLMKKSQKAAFYEAVSRLPIDVYYTPKQILDQQINEPWLRIKK